MINPIFIFQNQYDIYQVPRKLSSTPSGIQNDPKEMWILDADGLLPVLSWQSLPWKIMAFSFFVWSYSSNCKRWNKQLMHIPSSAPQGTMISKYDPINIILFISWKDSTVVQLISTTEILGIISVQEWIEPQKIMVPCGKNAADYVSKMGGVDKI